MTNTRDNLRKMSGFDWRVKLLIVIALITILASFFMPFVLTRSAINKDLDFSETGPIGDTIGGLISPFIALAGVIVTGLAFYIQYKANLQQRELFLLEQEENNTKFQKQINDQNLQIRIQQFESQFYEMLRLHKENVNEIEIQVVEFFGSRKESQVVNNSIRGRIAFSSFLKEFELCYYLAKHYFPNENYNVWINESYGIFFHGLDPSQIKQHKYYEDLYTIDFIHSRGGYTDLPSIVNNMGAIVWEYELNYRIFRGYSYQLAHYYRHLFQTVKFVCSQDVSLFSYEEKRKYLRILRAQLSNQEQALLFYNWHSNFGKQWENDKNKFFTDYRMIHNIYDDLLVRGVSLVNIFNLNEGYLREKNRDDDYLFEFQNWFPE